MAGRRNRKKRRMEKPEKEGKIIYAQEGRIERAYLEGVAEVEREGSVKRDRV